MDFKVTYLDAGLTSAYFNDGDTPNSNGSSVTSVGNSGNSGGATKVPKRYKAHLRDFLSSCRTKRSKSHNSSVSASDIYAAVDPAAAAGASAVPDATGKLSGFNARGHAAARTSLVVFLSARGRL